jgi:hypothetical protein
MISIASRLREIALHFQKSSARFAFVSAFGLSVSQEGNQ